ncbi:MAG: hypothetical protein EZS28_040277, partial [Streblomastix strix]
MNPNLRRRSAPPTLEQRKIVRLNLDNNENLGSIKENNSLREVRNRTKTTDQLPMLVLGLEKDTVALKNNGMILKNQEMTLEIRIPEVITVSDASPKGWGVTLELQTEDILVQLGKWNRATNQNDFIRSHSSTIVQDITEWRSGATLVAEVKKIVKLRQQLRIQRQTQNNPEFSNKITDALSRQSTQGDYSANKEIFRILCLEWQITPALYLFTTEENKLLERFVAINEQKEEAVRLNAFSRPWRKQIFWIYTLIPKTGKVQITWYKFKPKSFMIEQWWLGQVWLTVFSSRQQQIPYSWTELSDSEPGEGDDQEDGHVTTRKNRSIPHGPRVDQERKLLTEFLDNIYMTRETQQMIIEGQKFNTQKKYMQTMGVFDDWMKGKNYTIQDTMNQKIPYKNIEFMTWLTRTRKTKPSSAKHHASILNTMLSLIFGTVQVSTTVWRLTAYAISNHQINNPRYGSTWDINQLYEYWRVGPEILLLSNKELLKNIYNYLYH